ncbi:uncharacterized protein Dvir_GJ16440 [Drosophila virilis]|nr:uncharacterized protein Dvir_GJ16440 [Drosophila virilis]
MGFPRILSKNNKIYTKLGEFCLSGDSFWIVCHTCQEELQTQDAFWKHIQDEHNFLHGLAKQEHGRNSSYCLPDVDAATAPANQTALPVPLALYHCAKYSEEEQREVAAAVELHEAQQQVVPGPPPPPPPTPCFVTTPTAGGVSTTPPHPALAGPVGAGGNGGNGANATVMQQACGTLGMPLLGVAAGQAELVAKESNSTTASASSAVSSDDGERWYICDYGACGLKFKYKSRMELHRVVHSKERRFNCDMCSASFKQSCNLSTHRKKKHSLRGIKSELLPQRF